MDISYKKNQIFGKEPNREFETKHCKKEQKKNQKNQTKYSKPNALKRTRFEVFGFNETKLATLVARL